MIVVHAVRSDAFHGVERYITTVATRLRARAIDVRVVGGDPARMQLALGDDVRFTPARTTWDVATALRSTRADIVHVHMTAAELAAAISVRSTPIVSTRHFIGRRGASFGGRAASWFIRHRLAAQLSISDAVAASIDEPSTRLYNGVANRDPGAHAHKTVLVLQRLEQEKDTALALRAWARASARHAGWSLEIAGDGSKRAELEALAASLGLQDSVRFLGHVSTVDELLSDAGMVLATAPREPFGLSVVEAMATAAPVVAAAGGAHLETVGATVDARLFPPGDADACAQQIDQLAADAAGRATYGDALRREQRCRFDIDRHVDALLELYARFA